MRTLPGPRALAPCAVAPPVGKTQWLIGSGGRSHLRRPSPDRTAHGEGRAGIACVSKRPTARQGVASPTGPKASPAFVTPPRTRAAARHGTRHDGTAARRSTRRHGTAHGGRRSGRPRPWCPAGSGSPFPSGAVLAVTLVAVVAVTAVIDVAVGRHNARRCTRATSSAAARGTNESTESTLSEGPPESSCH